jgi:drug/metabolite transporter (DMT)-like permease
MFPAILTTMLFALSAASAGRTTRLLGSKTANFARLSLATLWLALWAYSFGQGAGGPSFSWFFLSGIVGFGVGDLALYAAFPRIGAQLAVLLTQCLAAPLGAIVEWVWLGTTLSLWQIVWGTVILLGVTLALWPDSCRTSAGSTARLVYRWRRILPPQIQKQPSSNQMLRSRRWISGTILGIVAAVGQGGGAVITRKAYAVAQQAGWHIDGGTAAFQRILGGISLTAAVLLLHRMMRKPKQTVEGAALKAAPSSVIRHLSSGPRRRAWPWVIVNSLAGPAIGVGCYQWALSIAPTGIVLAIVATTPLAVIPFVYTLEGERPTFQSLLGGAVAVLGAVALTQ